MVEGARQHPHQHQHQHQPASQHAPKVPLPPHPRPHGLNLLYLLLLRGISKIQPLIPKPLRSVPARRNSKSSQPQPPRRTQESASPRGNLPSCLVNLRPPVPPVATALRSALGMLPVLLLLPLHRLRLLQPLLLAQGSTSQMCGGIPHRLLLHCDHERV